MLSTRTFESPLGTLHLSASARGVRAVSFGPLQEGATSDDGAAHLDLLVRELEAYFDAGLGRFSVALDAEGTEFQRRVWRALLDIPRGETRSYLDIARSVGNPSASRAVGLANGANPIAIVVPCHRVIGSSGTLTGYAGELWRKRWLLDHERAEGEGLFRGGDEASCAAEKRFRLPC